MKILEHHAKDRVTNHYLQKLVPSPNVMATMKRTCSYRLLDHQGLVRASKLCAH